MTFYVPFDQFRTHDLSAGRLSTTLLITAPTDQFSAAEIVYLFAYEVLSFGRLVHWFCYKPPNAQSPLYHCLNLETYFDGEIKPPSAQLKTEIIYLHLKQDLCILCIG